MKREEIKKSGFCIGVVVESLCRKAEFGGIPLRLGYWKRMRIANKPLGSLEI
jgi:hypothetical protein